MEKTRPAERFSFISFLTVLFVLPIFFFPASFISLALSKYIILLVGAVLVCGSLALFLWEDARSSVKGNPFLIASILLLVAYSTSAVALINSHSLSSSFFGLSGEVDSVLAMSIFVMLGLSASVLMRKTNRIFSVLLALAAAGATLVIFHLLKLIGGGEWLLSSFFPVLSTTPFGGWYSLSLFIGLWTLLSALAVDLLKMRGVGKVVGWVCVLLGLVMLAIINFSTAWIMVLVASLVAVAYVVWTNSKGKSENDDKLQLSRIASNASSLPKATFIIFLLCLAFMLAGSSLTSLLPQTLGIDYAEIRPSWNSTYNISKEVISESPMFGFGPGQFEQAWREFKPAGINTTSFWNISFESGVGVVPSSLVTTGILGFLSWIILFGVTLHGIRRLHKRNWNNYFIPLTLSVTTLYLWASAIFYTPGRIILALLFVFIGGVSALAYSPVLDSSEPAGKKSLINADRILAGLLVILTLMVLVVGVRQVTAGVFFGKASQVFAVEGNIPDTINNLNLAREQFHTDLYDRALAGILIQALDRELAAGEQGTLDASSARGVISDAISLHQNALSYNQNNFENWLSFGALYEYLAVVGVDGAYEASKNAYEQAQSLDPTTPLVDLVLARLELSEGNTTEAEAHLNEALRKKPDYVDALLLRSDLSLSAGDSQAALDTLLQAGALRAGDPRVLMQIGRILYNQERFEEASVAFGEAIRLDTSLLEPRYLQGLALYQAGQTEAAISVFEELTSAFPQNQDFALILSNFREGLNPFDGFQIEEATTETEEE